MLRRWVTGSIAVVLVVGSFFGCKKAKEGDPCSGTSFHCSGDKSAMICLNGKYVSMPCRGMMGCMSVNNSCDQSVAQEKDACTKKDTWTCTDDKKTLLICDGTSLYAGSSCKGPMGCQVIANKVTCNNDVADLGDPCPAKPDEKDYACSSDASMLLICKDHKMVGFNSCRGARACKVEESAAPNGGMQYKIMCDDDVAVAGDPCAEPGEQACSQDKKSMLQCTDGKFTTHKTCPGNKGCACHGENGQPNVCACDGPPPPKAPGAKK
jgi:hypothetical protein